MVRRLAVLKGHSDCLKMRENPLAAGRAPSRTLLGELTALPRPIAGGAAPSRECTPAVGPLGLQLWPFGPRSLPPQIRLPQSAYVVN